MNLPRWLLASLGQENDTEDRSLVMLRSSPGGLRALTALVVLCEHVIWPLLAASARPKTDSKLVNPMRIDQH